MTASRVHVWLMAAVLMALAGCAQQPVKTDHSASHTVSTAAANAPASAKTNSYGVSSHLLETARDQGYRPRMENGKAYFCKTSTLTGDLIPTTYCISGSQLAILVQHEENERQRMTDQAAQCGNSATCGGG